MVPGAHGYTVVDDWDCMLNQTNIGQNNNKYYIIQLLLGAFQAYYVWSRWGRVVCSDVEEGGRELCNIVVYYTQSFCVCVCVRVRACVCVCF